MFDKLENRKSQKRVNVREIIHLNTISSVVVVAILPFIPQYISIFLDFDFPGETMRITFTLWLCFYRQYAQFFLHTSVAAF